MPGADEPPVVTQCATPRAAIASARSAAISLGGRRGHRLGRGQHRAARAARRRPSSPASHDRRGHPDRVRGERVPPARLERLASRSTSRPARRLERAGPSPGRRRARRGRGRSRPRRSRRPAAPSRAARRGSRPAASSPAASARRPGGRPPRPRSGLVRSGPGGRGGAAPSRRAAGAGARRVARASAVRRQRRRRPHAQPRGQPRDVVQRLDDVGRPGRAGLVVGRVGHRDPAERAEERQEVGRSKTEAIASRQRDWRTRAKSRIDSRRSSSTSRPAGAAGPAPSPDQAEPSMTSRSGIREQVASPAATRAAARRATRPSPAGRG